MNNNQYRENCKKYSILIFVALVCLGNVVSYINVFLWKKDIPYYISLGLSLALGFYWLGSVTFPRKKKMGYSETGIRKNVLTFWIYTISFIIIVSHIAIFIYKLGDQDYSSDIKDWGDYATCVATLISFIALYWIYKTYNSQIKLSSRMSFDQLFTQLLTNHHVIYQKVVEKAEIIEDQENVKIDGSAFEKMKVGILRLFSNFPRSSDISEKNIKNEYEFILDQMSHLSSVNMRNYFKYVYYEISTVEKACIDDNVKYDCIKLIQSQMNHDELICYLINQIQHISNEKHDKHLNDLQNRNFFEDIIEYSNKSNTKEKQAIKALLKMFESLPSNRH